jgi:hypothetical protein
MAMGFPFLAAFQSGVFYPPHFLFLILPFFPAIRALFVCHFLIAGIGTYCLCRSWKFPPYLSIVGALLFTLGGTLVSLSNLLNHFQTAVWLPWLILSWEKVLGSCSWRNFLGFIFIATMQFLAGSPELFSISMILVLIDGMKARRSVPAISYGKLLLIFLTANLLVLGLAMVQVLPTAELFLQSRRQQPIPPQEALHWSLKPVNLLNLFFLDKEIDFTTSKGVRLFFARELPFFITYYIGAISAFGISLWLYFSSLREKITLLSLVGISLAAALGSYTPIYPFLLHHLAFLGTFRFPEKIFFFTYVLLLFIALQGLAEFLLHHDDRRGPFLALTVVFVVWVILYILTRFNMNLIAQLIVPQNGNAGGFADPTKIVAAVMSNADRQVVLSLGFLLLLVLAKTETIRLPLFSVLVVSSVFVDLAWAHKSFLFPVNPSFVYGSRVLQTQEADASRFFYFPSVRDLHPSSVTVMGRPTLEESIALSFENLLPNAGLLYGVDYFQEIDALGRQPYTDFLFFANQLNFATQIKLLRAFNVKYLLSFKPLTEKSLVLIRRSPESLSWLYKIDGSLPRTYVVNKALVVTDAKQTLRLLASDNFDPAREVVLDHGISTLSTRQLKATAKLLRYENERVSIATSADGDAILVFADSYYPGWKAFVDGQEALIRRANLFFRAVALPAGDHTVEFRYEPRSFTIGLGISVLTLIALAAATVLLAVRSRSQSLSFEKLGRLCPASSSKGLE